MGSGGILSKADWYMYHRKYQAKPERRRPSIKPLSLFSGQPKLIAFFRDELIRHIYRSESDNDGVKWSRPTKTTLPNNGSGIQVTMSVAPQRLVTQQRQGYSGDSVTPQRPHCHAQQQQRYSGDYVISPIKTTLPNKVTNIQMTVTPQRPHCPTTTAIFR